MKNERRNRPLFVLLKFRLKRRPITEADGLGNYFYTKRPYIAKRKRDRPTLIK